MRGLAATLILFSMFIPSAFAGAQASASEALSESGTLPVAMQVIDLVNSENQRPIKVNLWYPTKDCDDQKTLCLADMAKRDRVILFSHGSMGSANDYAWLMRGLAHSGYIVVGLSHFGESWVYGQETIDPSSVVRFWQRTQDASQVLDQLAESDMFTQQPDWGNVVAIGHSAGGQTALALAGVTFNAGQITEYCRSDLSANDLGCAYSKHAPTGDNAPKGFLEAFSADYVDLRISSVIALDPAMGPGATVESLQSIDMPVLLIGAAQNDFLPFEQHLAYYASHIAGSKSVALNNGEGHFVFLDLCDHGYRAQGISLCKDRSGVERTKVHTQVLEVVQKFLMTPPI